jgi:hypothetical protein
MRPIPETIQQRINKKIQSFYENANPQMDVLLRRARSGLTGTDLFYVLTIREDHELKDLDALSIALERSDVEKGPHKAWNIYVKNGIAKVATQTLPMRVRKEWVDVLTIGPAVEVDITFDGQWIRDKKGRWNLITEGPPWIFWTTPEGQLYGQHWDNDEPLLLAEGVGKIAALRGWKNTYMWDYDQGIICCYIKDGAVYYRNYCRQPPDQPALWEIERLITEFPTPAQNVSLFRTNDYRTGFLCESNGQIYWALTGRDWAGMSVPVDTVWAPLISIGASLLEITEVKTETYNTESELISHSVHSIGLLNIFENGEMPPADIVTVTEAVVTDEHHFHIIFSCPISIWDSIEYMRRIIRDYTLVNYLIDNNILYLEVSEVLDTDGFETYIGGGLLVGKISAPYHLFYDGGNVAVRGNVAPTEETIALNIGVSAIMNITEIVTRKYDAYPRETIRSIAVGIGNVTLNITEVTTEHV